MREAIVDAPSSRRAIQPIHVRLRRLDLVVSVAACSHSHSRLRLLVVAAVAGAAMRCLMRRRLAGVRREVQRCRSPRPPARSAAVECRRPACAVAPSASGCDPTLQRTTHKSCTAFNSCFKSVLDSLSDVAPDDSPRAVSRCLTFLISRPIHVHLQALMLRPELLQ